MQGLNVGLGDLLNFIKAISQCIAMNKQGIRALLCIAKVGDVSR
jgi:hypothetical protein